MSKIVGYWRPFADDEDSEAEPEALRAAGAKRIVTAQPGNARSTRGFRGLIDDLRAGDTLLVTRASRLSSTRGQFLIIVADLVEHGIRFRSLAEPALSTGERVLTEEVFGALEALRRELISIRTREGLAAAAREGRRPGRPTVMTPDRIAMAKELRAVGRSNSHIARVLGVSPAAVQRALMPPASK